MNEVDTAKVSRRVLRFESLKDISADKPGTIMA